MNKSHEKSGTEPRDFWLESCLHPQQDTIQHCQDCREIPDSAGRSIPGGGTGAASLGLSPVCSGIGPARTDLKGPGSQGSYLGEGTNTSCEKERGKSSACQSRRNQQIGTYD